MHAAWVEVWDARGLQLHETLPTAHTKSHGKCNLAGTCSRLRVLCQFLNKF
jgi:hypothetical protein